MGCFHLRNRSNINGELTSGLLGIILVGISGFIYVFDPVDLIVDKLFTLSPNSLFYTMWKNPAYDAYFKVYIFNVTNSKEFLEKKEKLKFQEVGPFTYRLHLRNDNSTFNENGTLTYLPRRTFSFVPELSVEDPNLAVITYPNVILIGGAAILENSSRAYSLGLSSFCFLHKCRSFINSTVEEFLWDIKDPTVNLGRQLNPEAFKDKTGTLTRFAQVEGERNTMTIVVDPSKYTSKNSLLTPDERSWMFHIDKFNGLSGLPHLGYIPTNGNETREENTRCNLVEGSFDGLLFPRHTKANRTLRIFRSVFCRVLEMKYDGVVKTEENYNADKYTFVDNLLVSSKNDSHTSCFCEKSGCSRRGLISVSACNFGVPFALSYPHYLSGDPWLLEQIEGMKPNKSAHESVLLIEPSLKIPLKGHLRVQLNMVVGQTKVSLVKPFNGLVIPICWVDTVVEEIPFLVKSTINMFSYLLPRAQEILMYLSLLLGLFFVGTSVYIHISFGQVKRISKKQYNALKLKHEQMCNEKLIKNNF